MHRHCCLPAARHALYKDVVKRAFAYDFILFFLNRRNDIPKHCIPVLAQVFDQQLVICSYVAVIKPLQHSILDIICPFQAEVNAIRTSFSVTIAVGYTVCSLTKFIFIIHGRNRRTPVNHRNICLILEDTMFSNVNGLKQPFIEIPVINSPKKRLLISRLVFVQLVKAVLLQTP